jgi:hypothetical protein
MKPAAPLSHIHCCLCSFRLLLLLLPFHNQVPSLLLATKPTAACPYEACTACDLNETPGCHKKLKAYYNSAAAAIA